MVGLVRRDSSCSSPARAAYRGGGGPEDLGGDCRMGRRGGATGAGSVRGTGAYVAGGRRITGVPGS